MEISKNNGFVLISLLIVLAIILIWAAVYFGKSGSGAKSTLQTGNEAIQQTKENNAAEIQQNIETQNELNSIGN